MDSVIEVVFESSSLSLIDSVLLDVLLDSCEPVLSLVVVDSVAEPELEFSLSLVTSVLLDVSLDDSLDSCDLVFSLVIVDSVVEVVFESSSLSLLDSDSLADADASLALL